MAALSHGQKVGDEVSLLELYEVNGNMSRRSPLAWEPMLVGTSSRNWFPEESSVPAEGMR